LLALGLLPACSETPRETAGGVLDEAVPRSGNVIFVHPDGTGLNHWTAGRAFWKGPDGELAWDGLPELAVYRGHMADDLVGTSNGGATTHAFGVKVAALGSYGRDGNGDASESIKAASGYPGSIMREAAAAGYPVGVVNDGDLAEPGTGAFLAEVASRYDQPAITEQILFGRPGHADRPPTVVLGGGERYLLPEGTPMCGRRIKPDCAVHVDPVTGDGPMREDGRNLIAEAMEAGWTVVRTRGEFDQLVKKVARREDYRPRVLGLFAADDLFNDVPEERLLAAGLVDPSRPADDPRGRLVVWGGPPGSPSANPPTAREMTRLALLLLQREARAAGQPFMLVVEVESTDNLSNANNAIAALRALAEADAVIGLAREAVERDPETLLLVAADSDAGGLQVVTPPLQDDGRVTGLSGNPTDRTIDKQLFAVDGIEGRASQPFDARPDQAGRQARFAIAWSGVLDVAGGVVARADGLNSELLRTEYRATLDNTQVYDLMYRTLFGTRPGESEPGTPGR
jgi:alkaline phosphatase